MINFGFIFGTLDQIVTLSIFVFTFFILMFLFTHKIKISLRRALIIFSWHTLFSFFYLYLSITSVSDSLSYYEDAYYGDVLVDKTSAIMFITFINSSLIKYANFSYLGIFIFYNFIGCIGLFLIDSSLNSITTSRSRLINLIKNIIVFLPSISFWSSGIGKDTLAFFSISLFFWLYLNKKNFIFLLISFSLFFAVRPQHASILLFSSIVTLFFINNQKIYYLNFRYFKLLLFSFFSLMTLIFSNKIIQMSGIGVTISYYDLFSIETINLILEKIETKQNLPDYYGGGFIDLHNLFIFSELFTYIFRPLPYEAKSLLTLISSLENFLLLIFFSYSMYCVSVQKKIVERDKFFLIFFIIALLPLSVLTPNYGISARQKWIILIPMFYFLISTINFYHLNKLSINKK